ncbi:MULTISPECIES: threonine aldolase family protein [Clostridium]|uniref:Threonine aldolase n=1 Tax=Clostridium beijerinckii TaxID=1520 RepID=A0A1S9NCS2_CLOBE|nr:MULTISPECIES: low specificity L-threonine aldolase [Clostridium]MBN7574236.1 low specificity L-threonine aldolase [Clostridium beijerinckii]MBN7579292.1 low specificity L-threonine aldolase [Clostridium beijerinckii]MBN7583986.1 low specificity L-threonine aldolase [Clostridium beijerinckii]MBO0519444.1 low specificity L-threonine aldolase [Clostridium beijerinckii]MZK53701.1 aminotransferase class I/II-fold pyridoxal phosphate-dependent enzyme [Clostridium beijerinckii]
MYSFKNDYSEGAHSRILNALVETNLEQTDGYGTDQYTERSVNLLKKKIDREDVDIHLLVGGTQVNLTAISAFLRPHQAAVGADTSHINCHETGAIEATGHKVITMRTNDGKLTPNLVQNVVDSHSDEHMVQPKLVYISNSTELGTLYTKAELIDLHDCCKRNKLLLYLDGARLGSALVAEESDLTLADIAKLVDAFYIGGTKNGALFGEALVICNDELKEDFRYFIKQKGGLLAKGRLLGIQFEELFRDDLYFELAKHANKMALMLKAAIVDEGYKFLTESFTNQQFPILPNNLIEKLSEKYSFNIERIIDSNYTAIRLVTSWATKEENILEFIEDLHL